MISPIIIRNYLETKFSSSDFRIVKSGLEFTLNSIFTYDRNRHMSINLETGLWRCFKTGNVGNFVHLVSIVDRISCKEAYAKLLFKSLELGYTFEEENKKEDRIKPVITDINKFLEDKHLIRLGDGFELDILAYDYLSTRGNLHNYYQFYLGVEGPLTARLIIPYIIEDKILFYQARGLLPGMKPKYINDSGTKASNILLPFDYDKPELYITEGPLDAISLKALGFNATCINGSFVSKEQWRQLRVYGGDLIFGFDNDSAGKEGLNKVIKSKDKERIPDGKLFFCNPPNICKDWNESFVISPEMTKAACKNIRPLDYSFKVNNLLLNL